MNYINTSDKRIIVDKAREPKENEFVMHKSVLIEGDFIKQLLDYVAANSDLDWEMIPKEKFVNSHMRGFRIFKHAKVVTRDL